MKSFIITKNYTMEQNNISSIVEQIRNMATDAIISINENEIREVIDDGNNLHANIIRSDKSMEDIVSQITHSITETSPNSFLIMICANYDIMMDEMGTLIEYLDTLNCDNRKWGLSINKSNPDKLCVYIIYSLQN